MSGHNKWSKVKHKKAATDAKKSKIFARLAHEISLESKKSGGDTSSPGLRAAIEKARGENMPSDNIERAVKRGTGGESDNVEEVFYEAYGPGGCALVIEGLTDNKNRTSAEVRHTLSKNGFSLAEQGAASWAFSRKDGAWVPEVTVPIEEKDAEALARLIEQIEECDDVQEVHTNAAENE